jgi:hypothetical protein
VPVRLLRRFGPVGVLAAIALVFATTGGAGAASQHQTKPHKTKTGKRGPSGAPGVVGPRGDSGSKGETGARGEAGAKGEPGNSSYPTTLPSGQTEVGAFAVRFASTEDGAPSGESAISFPLPLAAAPSIATSAECTGTVSAPTAPPGEFCLYVGQGPTPGVLGYFEVSPTGVQHTLSRFGGAVNVASVTNGGDVLLNGTWAVSAP